MKAAVMKDIGVIKVEDVPDLPPGSDQAKVKIVYCGICGSDIERFEGRFGLAKLAGKSPEYPEILGHEASGTIIELGSNVKNFQVGQRVAMNFRGTCGACDYCRNKMENFCRNDYHATGAFAEYALYKESLIYPLPDNISMEEGALLEPVSIALHGIDRADIHPGNSVFISGAGTIGLLMLELARLFGAARIMVSDPNAMNRKLAQNLGADITINHLKQDVEQAGNQFTDGKGFDVVLEASGNIKAVEQSLSLAGKGGTVVWAGSYPLEAEVAINPFFMFTKELTIRSVLLSPYSFPRALNILPKLNLRSLISNIIPLQNIDEAFAQHKQSDQIKILIKP